MYIYILTWHREALVKLLLFYAPQQVYTPRNISYIFIHISYFYSTTKHEILQISKHNLLCSLDPPNQSRLFRVVGPKLVNDTEYNWLFG